MSSTSRAILPMLLALGLVLSAIGTFPTTPVSTRGDLIGLVCLSNISTSCPPAEAIFTGSLGSRLTVSVVVQGSGSITGFNIFVLANPQVLNPVSVSLTGTILTDLSSAMVCINGEGNQPECRLWLQNGPGVVQVLANGGPTGTLTTGLLFNITYDVVGTSSSSFMGFVCQYSPSGPTFPNCANVFDEFNVQERVQNAYFVNEPSVAFSLQTDKDLYHAGEVVGAKLNAMNNGTEQVTYSFADGCSGFRFFITDGFGSTVFSSVPPPGAVCPAIFTQITIQPGETKTVATLDWNQLDMLGRQVPDGTYNVFGVLHYQNPYQTVTVASKAITITPAPTIEFSKILTFDGVTVTISGSFAVDTVARALQGSATVTAVNTTSGQTVFSKTFTISATLTGKTIRFVLEIPVFPLTVSVNCGVDVSAGSAVCMVSRTPDVNNSGTIDIIDVAMLSASYGAVEGSPNYNPVVDLTANGKVDIFDAAILGAYYKATVFR